MKFTITLLVACLIGVGLAYARVQQVHAKYTGRLGLMDLDGKITAANVVQEREALAPTLLPVALTPDGTAHNFGVMKLGEKGSHTFTIKNGGVAPLTLRLGATTCKCTLGSLKSDMLAPGESTTVTLEWTVMAEKDVYSQSAELLTNDSDRIAIKLEVAGEIARSMKMQPDVITLGDVAAGEPLEGKVKLFSYMANDIDVDEVRFTGEAFNNLADIVVQPIEPASVPEHAKARQAFEVSFTVKPELKQGAIQQSLIFAYDLLDDQGQPLRDEDNSERHVAVDVPVVGRIVGALGMIPNQKLTGDEGGGWVYDFGTLKADDPTEGRVFVTLRGAERADTRLTVGKTYPEDVVSAELEPPLGQGSMTLHRLIIRLQPGDQPVRRLGTSDDDFGWVVIDSDNQKVPSMRILLKFAMDSVQKRKAELNSTPVQDDNPQAAATP